MKDKNLYQLYNNNPSDEKSQKQILETEGYSWATLIEDRFGSKVSPEDARRALQINIRGKPSSRERPKSAGDFRTRPKTEAEAVLVRKSSSLSNIEDFLLKRRVPLIKPLLSEREILKLQLLQELCRKKRRSVDRPKTTEGPQYEGPYEEELTKTRDDTSPLPDVESKEDEKRMVERGHKEEEKKIKSPISGKTDQETKKFKRDLSIDKSKVGTEKRKSKDKKGLDEKEKKHKGVKESIGKVKKEKQVKEKKEKLVKEKKEKPVKEKKEKPVKEAKATKEKQSSGKKESLEKEKAPKDALKSAKSKSKTSSEVSMKETKGEEKTKSKSKEKKSGEDMKPTGSDKSSSKGSSRKSSKQKLKPAKEPSKGASEHSGHSKEKTSQGKKSNKSDRSGSGKSGKIDDSPKKTKASDGDIDNKTTDQGKGKTKGSSTIVTDATKDKKTKVKPDKVLDTGDGKDKTRKSDSSGKTQKPSVTFPNMIQHIIHYVLSNPMFVELGWTLAPSDRAKQQVVTFRTSPTSPQTYCFRERTADEIKYYNKTLEEVAFHFRTNGTGEIYYPSGVIAGTISKHSTGSCLTLYSDPKNDPLISDSFYSKVLGIFDSSGNGVVYDTNGSKVLNFNQLEGIYLTPHRKSPYKWQWCDYKVLDKQRLKALFRFMAKEQKQPVPRKKSPVSPVGSQKKVKSEEKVKAEEKEKKSDVDDAYQQILAELPYPSPQKARRKVENQVWGFKPITLKINNEMTLRINGQDDVAVNFLSNQIFLRIDLGVKVDPDVVERIEALAPSKKERETEVPCVFDGLLEVSPSMELLKSGAAVKKRSRYS